VALPYALGNAAFGGTAEYVALAFKQAGRESGFYIYVGLVQAVACLVALGMRETQRLGLLVED
jgi:MFS transporter, MHS family, alpha-ketoglutarate permease